MRKTEVFDGKEIAAAWGLKLDPQTGSAKNSANAFNPWISKARKLAERYPIKFVRLVSELLSEIEN